jgi:hypothetical protein
MAHPWRTRVSAPANFYFIVGRESTLSNDVHHGGL